MNQPGPISSSHANSPPVIYVVDDNPALVELATVVLQTEGYEVRSFCDPSQALADLHRAHPKPDLLLTDFNMDEMNGLELVERSREFLPDLKAMLVSGTIEAEVIEMQPIKVNQFLRKPYAPEELVRLVRQLLDEGSSV